METSTQMKKNGWHKQYTLDDGTTTTVKEVASTIKCSAMTARGRLRRNRIRAKVFAPWRPKTKPPKKVEVDRKTTVTSYQMQQIMSRGLYDEMFRIALKSI